MKNHSTEASALAEIGVHLAHGTLKKVRLKSPDAFSILSSAKFTAQTDTALAWTFQLDSNSAITDNSGSLFLLYGSGDATEQLGHLQITVLPNEVIQEFLTAFTTQFRFIMKSVKANKGQVEAKLAPPASQQFATLDHVLVYFRFEGNVLEVHYVFVIKKIEATAVAFDVTKKKKELTQTLAQTRYRTSAGRINHEQLEAAIDEALALVRAKILF